MSAPYEPERPPPDPNWGLTHLKRRFRDFMISGNPWKRHFRDTLHVYESIGANERNSPSAFNSCADPTTSSQER